MKLLFNICFLLYIQQGISHVIFPEVLQTALGKLRFRREASCGGDIDLSGGSATIQLETEEVNGTEFYRQNQDCTWSVKTTENHYMLITSEYFSVEESDDCVWDFVEIRDRTDSTKYCGWDPPLIYITDNHEINIRFKSDVSYEGQGFKFNIVSKRAGTDQTKCNSSIVGGVASTIYNNDEFGESCFYRIQATGQQVVELELKSLHFASHSCDEESILIYSGLTNHGKLIDQICSETTHGVRPFHVNSVFIEYRNTLGMEGERFALEYSFVEDTFTQAPTPSTTPSPVGGNNDCSGFYKDIITDSGNWIYTAPEFENDKECIIVVRNTLLPNHVVQVKFLNFEIEESDDCIFDSLRVLSGERNDSSPLGGPYCGQSLDGRTFVTNGNSLRLEFRTDVSFALRGFKAEISFVPVKDCSCEPHLKCVRQGFEKKCIRARSCEQNKCRNGGTCLVTGSVETCYCAPGYSGDDCSKRDGSAKHILEFTIVPRDRRLKRKEAHIEECAVRALPGEEVEYIWTLSGVVIPPFDKVTGFGTHPGGLLEIVSFSDELDGQYSCYATSPSGVAEHTFEYRIVDDCDVRIERGPQSEQSKVGDNVLLQCKVDSRSKQVRWKKNGVYVDFARSPRFKVVGEYNYLRIENVQMEDGGLYRCEAEDKNGCFSYKEGTLTVINVKSSNEYCGISVHDEAILEKVSRGEDARPKENPWHVTFRSNNVHPEKVFCGGTLISQRFVLTAAHCIREFEKNFKQPWNENTVEMLFGTTDCLGNEPVTRRRPKRYVSHPDFSKLRPYDSDIAVVELDSDIEYTMAIRPICLEPTEYNDRVFLELSSSLIPTTGKVAGCGKKGGSHAIQAETLQVVHLPYVRRDECEESMEKSSQKLTKNMFCAGFNVARKGDTCSGDSGGGLVMTHNRRWIQTGIVSFSIGECDRANNYGVYTNVGNYYSWIDGITKFSEEEVPDFLSIDLR